MPARLFIKRLLPPIISEMIVAKRSPRYASWAQAEQAIKHKANRSYLDRTVNEFRVARRLCELNGGQIQPKSLLLLVTILLDRRNLKITDFGGATGQSADPLLERFPDLTYVVVENDTLVHLAREKLAHRLVFTTKIPEECDIFFTSGTLQYLSDYSAVLESAFSSAHLACVFARNSFSENPIFRIHHSKLFDNGGGADRPVPNGFVNRAISYPHRTVQERDIAEAAARHGFRLVFRASDTDGVLPYYDEVTGAQLVYLKER